MTMLAAWESTVARLPDAPAVLAGERALSFGEVDARAHAFGALLVERGVRRGDRVAVYLQNDLEWLVAMLACWLTGAIPVAVNPMLREAELLHHLNDSGARFVLTLPELVDRVPRVAAGTGVVEVLTPAQMPSGAAGVRLEVPPTSPDDVALLTYTSGTTGRPKAAMNLHRGMLHSSRVFAEWHHLTDDDVVLGAAPLFHITGSVAGMGVTMLTGAPLVLVHRFSASEVLDAIERHRATFTVATSTAYLALVAAYDGQDTSSLRHALSGGAPVAPATVERVRSVLGVRLRSVYGLTETTSPTHLTPLQAEPPVDPVSGALATGVPVPGCQVRIVDPETGEDMAAGQQGEIVVRGPMVVPGYWGLPEESADAIRDGWLHTGDIGVQGEGDWLFVVDRLKDLINAGGFKVWPREVEDVLYQHPAVREASVVGVPDDYRGETVKAFVSLREGTSVSPEELIAFCRERLAAYKYPRVVEVLPELPKTASGKLLRRELRDA